MVLSFMGIILGIGFFKSTITIGMLLMLIHPVGGVESIQGALKIEERYGGEIIEEINRDIMFTTQTVRPFEFKHKLRKGE